jgi:4-hydroxybutyrate CoA-transferase
MMSAGSEMTRIMEALDLLECEAVSLVTGQATAEPGLTVGAVLAELGTAHRQAGVPERIRLYRAMSLYEESIIPHDPAVRVWSTGMLGANRALWGRGQLDILPESVATIPERLRDGSIAADALLVRVTKTADGAYSTGLVSDYLPAAISSAAKLVAEICPEMPIVPGAVRIEAGRIDALVKSGGPLPQLRPGKNRAEDAEIGRLVAALVVDGDCIQIGIGSLSHAIARALAIERRDLGLHTGLIDDAVLALIDSGAVTNRRKAIDAKVSVAAVIAGTNSLYRALRGRTDLCVHPVDYTNRPSIVAQLDRFTAINSVIEVDLLGQLNAEMIGGHRVSSVGGQLDFCIAAHQSAGGKVIAVTRSTGRGGAVSTIVPTLRDAAVTVTGSLVDYVVTEYGVARLRGATLEERARRLATIAHPKFRRELLEAWQSDQRISSAWREPLHHDA